jgi:hypothetical protein
MSTTDQPTPATGRASQRFAELVGLPAPQRLTDDDEAAYQRWMQAGEDALAEVIARRAQRAA